MISMNQFQKGESEVQEYFEYRNATHRDGLIVLRNRPETSWFAMYLNASGGFELILEEESTSTTRRYQTFKSAESAIEASIEWYQNSH